jgi:hypothetical protein
MRTRLLALLVVLAPALVLAQARELKEKPPPPLNEIEHGFYIGITAGFWSLINPPANTSLKLDNGTTCSLTTTPPCGSKQYFSGGQTAQVELGWNFGERLSIGIFVQGTANRMGSDYTGKSQDPKNGGAPAASGDFTTVIPGANVRIGIVGFSDSQDVKRGWLYVRAGAGFVLYPPKALLPGPDVLVYAGPGLEYFTRLRHFSIGLEADFVFMALSASFGFTVTPMLRYAF